MFYIAQLSNDSLIYDNKDPNLTTEEEIISTNLKKLTLRYQDSSKVLMEKKFYITANE